MIRLSQILYRDIVDAASRGRPARLPDDIGCDAEDIADSARVMMACRFRLTGGAPPPRSIALAQVIPDS